MQQPPQDASMSSNVRKRSLEDLLQQDAENEEKRLQETAPESLQKIEDYLGQRKQEQKYSFDLIKEAMVHYCLHPETPTKKIAEDFCIDSESFYYYITKAKISKKPIYRFTEQQVSEALADIKEKKSIIKVANDNNMHYATLLREVRKRGEILLRKKIDEDEILECYKNGGTFEDIYKIVVSDEQFAKEKFARVISEKMTDSQKKQLVEENINIIEDYRKKLLTDKGRINKYKNRSIRIGNICERNFGECEDYLIRYVAGKLKYKLSKLPVKWNIEYENSKNVPEYIKQLTIKDANEGFLTYEGIAQKYALKRNTTTTILNKQDGYQVHKKKQDQKIINI